MRAPRVDDLVKGWVHRSYLERYGSWAQPVLDEFAFLLESGFSLTGSEVAGVHFHQNGHFVWFVGPDRDVAVDYDPETNSVAADVVEHDPPRFTSLDELITRHVPGAVVPRRQPLDRPAIEETVRWWAAGLRRISTDSL